MLELSRKLISLKDLKVGIAVESSFLAKRDPIKPWVVMKVYSIILLLKRRRRKGAKTYHIQIRDLYHLTCKNQAVLTSLPRLDFKIFKRSLQLKVCKSLSEMIYGIVNNISIHKFKTIIKVSKSVKCILPFQNSKIL